MGFVEWNVGWMLSPIARLPGLQQKEHCECCSAAPRVRNNEIDLHMVTGKVVQGTDPSCPRKDIEEKKAGECLTDNSVFVCVCQTYVFYVCHMCVIYTCIVYCTCVVCVYAVPEWYTCVMCVVYMCNVCDIYIYHIYMMFVLVYVCGIHGTYVKYVVPVWCILCMSVVSVQMGVQMCSRRQEDVGIVLCYSVLFP